LREHPYPYLDGIVMKRSWVDAGAVDLHHQAGESGSEVIKMPAPVSL
jgi:hypothetical protein